MVASGALDTLPNIIEAAKSTLGILGLAIITIALLGYGFFRKGSERVKMSMFVLMFLGAVVLAASILLTPAATGTAMVPTGAKSDPKAAERKRPILLRHSTGTVKWFNSGKGFGFIADGSGQDIFVSFSEITEPGYRSLEVGTEVQFDVLLGSKGVQAHNVKLLHTKK